MRKTAERGQSLANKYYYYSKRLFSAVLHVVKVERQPIQQSSSTTSSTPTMDN